jgi:hypothetical protein
MTLGTIAILVLLIYVIGYFPSVIIIAMIDKRIPSDVDLGDRYSFSAGMAIIWFLSIPVGLFILVRETRSFSFVLTYVEKVHFWIESKLERK